jgi:tetratricopeptide (TPR) repeat protein
VLLDARGDRSGALAAWQRALVADPALHASRIAIAFALATQGRDLDTALALARDAQAARPRDARALDTLGFVWLRRSDGREATRWLRQAVGALPVHHPSVPEVRFRLALALARSGDAAAARATARGALAALAERGSDAPWAAEARAMAEAAPRAASSD